MDKNHREELSALQQELGGRTAASQEDAASQENRTELDRALEELHRALAGAAAEAEEMVAEHPMASLAAAFCVGMIVGRLSGAYR
jgi:ElaB/YqjD/DUF883 family membrane-anchored ribosome-binding protein